MHIARVTWHWRRRNKLWRGMLLHRNKRRRAFQNNVQRLMIKNNARLNGKGKWTNDARLLLPMGQLSPPWTRIALRLELIPFMDGHCALLVRLINRRNCLTMTSSPGGTSDSQSKHNGVSGVKPPCVGLMNCQSAQHSVLPPRTKYVLTKTLVK